MKRRHAAEYTAEGATFDELRTDAKQAFNKLFNGREYIMLPVTVAEPTTVMRAEQGVRFVLLWRQTFSAEATV